jgi:hypothetical protein
MGLELENGEGRRKNGNRRTKNEEWKRKTEKRRWETGKQRTVIDYITTEWLNMNSPGVVNGTGPSASLRDRTLSEVEVSALNWVEHYELRLGLFHPIDPE